MGKPKRKSAPPCEAPKSQLHDSPSVTSIEQPDVESGSKLSSGSEVWCTATISLYSLPTTRSKVASAAATTSSQSEEEADSSDNEEGSDNEKDNVEEFGYNNEEEFQKNENVSGDDQSVDGSEEQQSAEGSDKKEESENSIEWFAA